MARSLYNYLVEHSVCGQMLQCISFSIGTDTRVMILPDW